MKHSAVCAGSCFAPFLKVLLCALLSFAFFFSSCKHEETVPPVVNPKFIPGNKYNTQLLAIKDSLSVNTFDYNQVLLANSINRATGFPTSSFDLGRGVLDNYDHQGLIIGDVYYFLLRSDSVRSGCNLQCIILSTESTQSIYMPGLYLSYFVFDSLSQTFFAKSHFVTSDSLVSFQIKGNKIINYKNIIAVPNNIVCMTIDPLTSKIYLLTSLTGGTQLYVYNQQTLQNIPLSDNSAAIIGLRFNKNDNYLYGLQGTNIIKISTSTGLITKLYNEAIELSTDIFGAVLDQSNNQYIISAVKNSSADTGVIIVYDNSKNQLAITATPWFCYTALSVKYY